MIQLFSWYSVKNVNKNRSKFYYRIAILKNCNTYRIGTQVS